jgi:hypothetical protein
MNSLSYLFKALPWLGFFTAVVLSWYFYLKARNKERMARIEKGLDVPAIKSEQEINTRGPWLKIGILLTGIALGITIASIIVINIDGMYLKIPFQALMLICGLLFGGISMIIAHFVDRPAGK